MTTFSEKDNDDIINMRNNMLQEQTANIVVKKKHKGLFSKMEEKIQTEQEVQEAKKEAQLQDEKDQLQQ